MRPYYVFDRFGKMTGTIPYPIDPEHVDTVNGEDSLTLGTLTEELSKGDRIVWCDRWNEWHEHTVADTSLEHSDQMEFSVYAENSISELLTLRIESLSVSGASAATALSTVLSDSRWEVGNCDALGTVTLEWEDVTVYEAVTEIVEALGAELRVAVEVDGDTVGRRTVAAVSRLGSDTGQLFTYSRQVTSVTRTVTSADVYTALYGYGKGDSDSRLTFADINGGSAWVGDEEARLRWGVPDGRGGVRHSFGSVTFSDCEDEDELLRLTREALDKAKEPEVSYDVSIADLGDAGVTNGDNLRKGDTINIRDEELDIRLTGRVLQVKGDPERGPSSVTIGNVVPTLTGGLGDDLADLDWLKEHRGGLEDATNLGTAYLNAVIAKLNEEINLTGGYTYWEPGEGITTYDKPIDQNPTKVIQLKGGFFRIANGKLANGDWDWRTIGSGDGLVADALITGKIKGGSNEWDLGTGDLEFSQGTIHDAVGNNFWNLSNGELSITSGAKVGDQTLQSYIEGLAAGKASDAVEQLENNRLTQQAIFNTLTGGGSTQGIYLQSGRVYINASYIGTGTLQAGRIQDKNGYNYWDLETGSFRLSPSTLIGSSSSSQTLSSYISSNSKDSFADATALEVFNKLTNNGRVQGITMDGNNLYINATYINSGTLSGDYIKGGVIGAISTNSGSTWNLTNGIFTTHTRANYGGQYHDLYVEMLGNRIDFKMDQTVIGQLLMFANSSDPNYHCFEVASYSDIRIAFNTSFQLIPNGGPGSGSGGTRYTGLASSTVRFLKDVSLDNSDNTLGKRILSFTKGSLTVNHGIVTAANGSSSSSGLSVYV